ncbi:hypothetical protein WG922_17945 [Ramlibacter sp. AN1015]|uniref:hypothetical protein n=1 Tax=Ramlibacter sp. AN1015 TaxID=3133428 RepID=UPI0030C2BBB1
MFTEPVDKAITRIAVMGAGPSGPYAAQALRRAKTSCPDSAPTFAQAGASNARGMTQHG